MQSLARRGLAKNVVGYTVYGDYSKPNPPAELVHAVARGDVDIAVVWGPLAGYFAGREPVPLDLVPVSPPIDGAALPYVYDIAIGVRHRDTMRLAVLDRELHRRRSEITQLLSEYGVPLLAMPAGK